MNLDDDELKATKEKTADEMFEELGYRSIIIKEKIEMLYIHRGYIGINRIFFNNLDKKVHLELDYDIDMQELKAIYKKCEELGWLDE